MVFTGSAAGGAEVLLLKTKFTKSATTNRSDMPLFKHFTKDLSLSPTEYFQRQCYIGASFMPPHEGANRHRIGLDKLMWGSDFPHIEGTWPNTMDSLRATFAEYPEDEIRKILGTNAAEVYGFDLDVLAAHAKRVGPLPTEI